MTPSLRSPRFWLYHALLPVLLLGMAITLLELTGLDLLLSDPFFDPARGGWYLKQNWWTEQLIHRDGRALIAAIGAGSLLGWIGSFRSDALRPWRRAALYLTLCIALGTGLVAVGKAAINRHAPWDYQRYGGAIPYVGLFVPPEPGYPAGHDFPAGHASGGFALMGSYFIFYRSNRRRAWAGLAAGLLLGSIFGVGQQLRGAHFASHNLWTILVCWSTALLLYAGVFRGNIIAPKGTPPRKRLPASAQTGILTLRRRRLTRPSL